MATAARAGRVSRSPFRGGDREGTLPAFAAVLVILAAVLCAASLAIRESWAKALFVLALILLAWTVVDGQEVPPMPTPMPPPPGQPCMENPAAYCTPVTMAIEGDLRSFTAQDFGGRAS